MSLVDTWYVDFVGLSPCRPVALPPCGFVALMLRRFRRLHRFVALSLCRFRRLRRFCRFVALSLRRVVALSFLSLCRFVALPLCHPVASALRRFVVLLNKDCAPGVPWLLQQFVAAPITRSFSQRMIPHALPYALLKRYRCYRGATVGNTHQYRDHGESEFLLINPDSDFHLHVSSLPSLWRVPKSAGGPTRPNSPAAMDRRNGRLR